MRDGDEAIGARGLSDEKAGPKEEAHTGLGFTVDGGEKPPVRGERGEDGKMKCLEVGRLLPELAIISEELVVISNNYPL